MMQELLITILLISTILCFAIGTIFSFELYLVTDKGILLGQFSSQHLSFHRMHYTGQFSRMAIDTKNGLAFLYDSETKVIYKASLRTHGQLQDIVIAIGEVQDIAVDNIKEKVYWTDRQLRSIGIANYDGSVVSKLINNLNSPKSLAIDSLKGIMFWSDDFDQSVEQLIIGECVRSVIMRDVIATTLTVDTENHVLYIYENYSNRLIAYSYIDVAPARTPIPLSQQIYAVSVFQGSIITILSKDSYACINIWNNTDLNTSSYCDIGFGKIHQLITSFTETKGYRHNENNKDNTPDCAVSKAMCIKYSKNRKDCILASRNYDDSPFLLIADQRGRALYKIDAESMEKSVIPVKELDQPYGISFDMVDDMVYWTDIGSRQNSISRAYLDGSFQEIIFSHQDLYSTAVEIDSDLRLAFFNDFSFHRIGVLHIPSLTYKYILQEEHFHPFSFHLHTHNNYPEIYISKHGSFPRIVSSIIGSRKTIGVTDEAVKPRGVYLDEKDLYWIDSYDNTVKHLNTTSGNPSTMLYGYLHEMEMRDLELYRNKYMFVSDVKNGRLMRFNLTEMHEKMDTSSYMIATTITDLYAPSGMTLVDLFKFDLKVRDIKCSQCDGVCLGNDNCLTDFENFVNNHISTGFCIIPHTLGENVEVINARRRTMVYNGYTLSVSCKRGLHLENPSSPIRCINGNWTNLPMCVRDGEIHGTEDKGWKLFLENGQFYISPEMMTLSVVVIGGGGGGFDNSTLLSVDHAGRGEDSMFLDVFAEGGKGGTLQRGGKGGGGNVYDGKDGGQENSCSTIKNCNKVDRMETFLRSQHDYSPTSKRRCACCKINESDIDDKRGKTYTSLCDSNGMEFGVGGQGNSGWSGGDGGISCNMIYKDGYPEHRTVDIQVGKGGSQSYTTAGNGMVLVTWGMGNACVVL